MEIVSALIFASALALIVLVVIGTLLPAVPRIVAALGGETLSRARDTAPRRRVSVSRGRRVPEHPGFWRDAA